MKQIRRNLQKCSLLTSGGNLEGGPGLQRHLRGVGPVHRPLSARSVQDRLLELPEDQQPHKQRDVKAETRRHAADCIYHTAVMFRGRSLDAGLKNPNDKSLQKPDLFIIVLFSSNQKCPIFLVV